MEDAQRYELWNSILTEHCLLSDAVRGVVSLTVTPRILSSALQQEAEETLSPEESEADFAAAAGKFYREQILTKNAALDVLLRRTQSGSPSSVAFLALTVLAAYRMQTDDDHTGRAYYPRLARLLGCDLAGAYPPGFQPAAFEALWDDLALWLRTKYNRQLALPNGGGRLKYLAFPMAHVPLRQVDIERLPRFFDANGYEPRTRAPLERLAYDLYERAGPWRYFTEAGQNALADPDRRPLVVRQIALELEHWDGARTDAQGRREASIEIWMDIRQRRAKLHLLARRPHGFPETIAQADFVFASQEDGWYEPLPLGPDDGPLLEHGMIVQDEKSSSGYLLKLRPIDVLPLTPSEEFSGFVADGALRANTRCAVLCRNAVAGEVARFLTTITNGQIHPRLDDTLPKGWSLFTDVIPLTVVDPPSGFQPLRVETTVGIAMEGGLRFGRRWTWLEDAPPKLRIIGAVQAAAVCIDGQTVSPDSEGYVPTALLSAAGQHILQVGNQIRRRIAVMPASINPNCLSWACAEPNGARFPVLLPGGEWILIGAAEGDHTFVLVPPEGGLANPAFAPSWAIRSASRSGATVLHIHALGQCSSRADSALKTKVRKLGRRHLPARAWAEAIYQAHIRRPHIVCIDGCPSSHLALEWRRLFDAARAAKRRGKVRA